MTIILILMLAGFLIMMASIAGGLLMWRGSWGGLNEAFRLWRLRTKFYPKTAKSEYHIINATAHNFE
jgi:hypothetical protein